MMQKGRFSPFPALRLAAIVRAFPTTRRSFIKEVEGPSMRKPLIGAGLVISFISLVWWHNEVKSFLGDRAAEHSGRCVYNLGTGDCANFWLAGLHQTNQEASALFYGGLLMVFFGCFTDKR
jgi:hypothetical protein